MTPEEVHSALRRHPDHSVETKSHEPVELVWIGLNELFYGLSLRTWYSRSFSLVAIWFNAHTFPQPTLFGREFYNVSLKEIIFWIKLLDPQAEEHDSSVISLKYGIQVYFECKESDELDHHVMVFSKDLDQDLLERDHKPKGWGDLNYET